MSDASESRTVMERPATSPREWHQRAADFLNKVMEENREAEEEVLHRAAPEPTNKER